MLDTLITSKTRIRLLVKFFSNPANSGYLRSISEEFGESTNAVRVELNRLQEANLLNAESEGRTKVYKANPKHPLFTEISGIVNKYLGLDQSAEKVIQRLGNVDVAFITGDYAKGKDSGIIDLVVVGNVDEDYLLKLSRKAEDLISRKIRVLTLSQTELDKLK